MGWGLKLRHHLLHMHTTNYICLLYEKRRLIGKNLTPIGGGGGHPLNPQLHVYSECTITQLPLAFSRSFTRTLFAPLLPFCVYSSRYTHERLSPTVSMSMSIVNLCIAQNHEASLRALSVLCSTLIVLSVCTSTVHG